jgi:hypothetical protein
MESEGWGMWSDPVDVQGWVVDEDGDTQALSLSLSHTHTHTYKEAVQITYKTRPDA